MQFDISASRIPYFANWIGAWAMHSTHFQALYEQVQRTNVSMHLASVEERRELLDSSTKRSSTVIDGIAIVSIDGVMLKHQQSLSGGVSTVLVRQELRRLAHDSSIKGVCLKMCTPGGSAAGTLELGEAIKYVSARKPIWAYGSDLVASAGYWAASQCDRIETNKPCHIGSIGTYAVVHDLSEMAAKEGVKVHVIRAGAAKGVGTPGTEITDEQLASIQADIDGINALFLDAVASGRCLASEQLQPLATGQTWIGQDAVDRKLSDGVATFDDFFERFRSHCESGKYRQRNQLLGQTASKPASVGNRNPTVSSQSRTNTGRTMGHEDERSAFLSELATFTEKFGQVKGLDYLTRGMCIADAALEFSQTIQSEHKTELDKIKTSHASELKSMQDQLATVVQERDSLQQRLEQAKASLGEKDSVDVGSPRDTSAPKSMLDLVRSNKPK